MDFQRAIAATTVCACFAVSDLIKPEISAQETSVERTNDASKASVRIPFLSGPISIDGRLDEKSWGQGARLAEFVQTQPGDNTAPSYPTEVRIGYDAHHLYVGIRAIDTRAEVRATLAKRDDVLRDDHVEILLDTFDDARRAYVLGFNPLGVQQDGIWIEGELPDYSVDIVMASKGEITDSGYTLEIAVPFRSLRYASGGERTWGMHVRRRIKHLNDEENSWMPLVRGRAGYLAQAGHISGLDSIAEQRPIEIISSLTTAGRERRLGSSSPASMDRDVRMEPGLSAKLGLASNSVVELALNPDFAQVEADAVVVTANQRFPILYEEKRPFFLEGIELLQTPLRAVHTRTIIDPDVALKGAGKRGGTSFGVIVASDNAPGDFSAEEQSDSTLRPGITPLIGRNATIGVMRVRHDIGSESSVGLLGAGYHFVNRSNYLAGFDGRLTLDPRSVVTFQVLGTTSRRDHGSRDHGLGYFAQYRRTGRHLSWNATAEGLSPDYAADVGFTRQTNLNVLRLLTRYDAEPKPDGALISWSVTHTGVLQADWQGRLTYAYLFPGVLLNFRHQAFVHAYAYVDYVKLLEEEFGPRRSAQQLGAFAGDGERSTVYRGFSMQAGITPDKRYSVTASISRAWDTFDYDFGASPRFERVSPAALSDPGAALDPGPANSLDAAASIQWQPTDAFRSSVSYTKSRLFRTDTWRLAYEENIYSVQATNQFGRFIFVRARGDFTSLRSNLRGQLLAGWTPSPGTAVYIGYDDDLDRNWRDPVGGQAARGLRRNGRSLFAKISYSFRKSV